MDLVTVSKKDFTVGKLVEGYSTLIWTERFQNSGEFELHTNAIHDTRKSLPERSLVTLRDSPTVMMVLSHAITEDDSGIKELVVKGRTLDDFLRKRNWNQAKYGKQRKMAKNYTVRQAVEVWVWNAIVNGSGNDVVNTDASRAAGNKIPNVIVTDSVPSASDGSSKARKVQNGNCYDQMRAFLSSGKLGIRIIRPNNTSGRKVSVAGDGTWSTDHVTGIDDLRFDIYQGRDRTDGIVFSYKAGDLIKPSYVFSSEEYRGGVFVDGDPRTHYYTDPDLVPGPNTGWTRMDGYLDGGSMEDLTQGEHESDSDFADRKAAAADDFEDSLEDVGMKALRRDFKHVSIIDAQISPFARYKYRQDYHLGDRVRVQGEYGINQTMWVLEYIRTKDSNGIVGYPTLSTTPS